MPASLITPFDWSIDFHIWAATTVGIAHGTSITAAHDAAAPEPRVDDEGDGQPERELERHRDHCELERRPDGVAEDRVVEQVR